MRCSRTYIARSFVVWQILAVTITLMAWTRAAADTGVEIVDFSSAHGTLTWTQRAEWVGSTYRIEWAPNLLTNFSANYDALRGGEVTDTEMTVEVPFFYRVAIYTNLSPLTQIAPFTLSFTNNVAQHVDPAEIDLDDLRNTFNVPARVNFMNAGSGELSLSYTPNLDVETDQITFLVSDNDGRIVTGVVEVVVQTLAPTAEDISTNTFENAAVEIDVHTPNSDPGGFDFGVVSWTAPADGNVTGMAGETNVVGWTRLLYTPDEDFTGTNTFDYVVENQPGVSATGAITVVVEPLLPPTAIPIATSTPENVTLIIPVHDLNESPAGSVFGADTNWVHTVSAGTVYGADANEVGWSNLVYEPPPFFYGTATVDYVMVDESSLTSTVGVITIDVVSTNTPLQAVDDTYFVSGEDPTELDVLANDINPYDWDPARALAIESFTQPTNGVVTFTNDNTHLVYTPTNETDSVWRDSFTYQITDGVRTSEVAAVDLECGAVYAIIDVSGGTNAVEYPVHFTHELDTSFTNVLDHAYRTTNIVLRYVYPGSFMRGSATNECGRISVYEDTPQSTSIASGFYLGIFEITQAQYENVAGLTPSVYPTNNTHLAPLHPVDTVSVRGDLNTGEGGIRGELVQNTIVVGDYHGLSFMGLLRDRLPEGLGLIPELPTNFDWEYAARAGTTNAYNDGTSAIWPDCFNPDQNILEALDALMWYSGNAFNQPGADNGHRPVGLKQPNAWGFYDMHGNVNEVARDTSKGISFGSGARASRGGSWMSGAAFTRAASVLPVQRTTAADNLGFRLQLIHVP